ncbi:MAG: HEPN domain-containing protein [Chloroflexia bacterium]
MTNRAPDWFRQALRDLEQAEDSRQAGRHEWACFASHQAAEKAIKALHLHLGQEAWGHSVARLLQDLPATVPVPPELIEQGRVLDNFYIPSRYPNSHPEGAPFEHYGPLQSGEALHYARAIVEFVRSQMA